MNGERLLPYLFLLATALFGFDLLQGLRTDRMRFRPAGAIGFKAHASRRGDPRQFWTYALCNAVCIGLALSAALASRAWF